jgi:uncharacterized delta-60 repeat protein
VNFGKRSVRAGHSATSHKVFEGLEARRLLAAGDLDLTFGGGDGLTTFSTQAGSQIDRGLQVAVDPLGRIVTVGTTAANRNFGTPVDLVVARFTSEGLPDPTFGVGGKAFVTFSFRATDIPVDLAVQPDGKILVALRAATTAPWGVLRLTEVGVADPTFGGGDGLANYDFGSSTITKMALQSDGKIVTIGSATNFTTGVKGTIVRMKDDGTLDPSFSGDGIATVDVNPGGFTEFFDVALDGARIVALGHARPAGSGQFDSAVVARFTPAGDPDPTFASPAQISVPSTYVLPHSIAVDSASRVYVATQLSTSIFLTPLPLNLYRLTSSGAPDLSFNATGPSPGRLEVPDATYLQSDVAEMLIGPDGKLLFGGAYTDATSNAFNIVRVNPDGTLDGAFAGDGTSKFTPTGPLASGGTDMALDAQGRLVISGVAVATATDYDLALVRVETGIVPPADPVTLTAGGVLRIRGTDANDTVVLAKQGNDFLATLNGQTYTFAAADVLSIDVELYGGDDHETHDGGVPGGRVDLGGGLTNSVTLNSFNRADSLLQVFGGAGNDTVEIMIAAFTPVFFDGGQDDSSTDYLIYHGSTGNDTFNVTASRIDNGGFYEAQFANVEQRVIYGDFGFDTFHVTATGPGICDLYGDEGDDTFDLINGAANTLVASTNIYGGEDTDTFIFDDSAGGSTQGPTILGDIGAANFNGYSVDFDGIETLHYLNGPAAGSIFVRPSPTVRMIIDGKSPNADPGDILTIDPNSLPLSQVRTSSHDGSITFGGGKQPVEYLGFERVISPLDTTKPTATPHFETLTRQSFIVDFSEDVMLSINAADLVLKNLTTGQTISPINFVLNTSGGANLPTRAEWTTFFAQPFPDGNYRAQIAADAVRDYADNPLAAPISFDFFILAGDANHDRKVDFTDLVAVAQNYNTNSGATFNKGDFNYDGKVDFTDLVMLAQRYGTTLAAPATVPVFATAAESQAIFSSSPRIVHAPAKPKSLPPPRRR